MINPKVTTKFFSKEVHMIIPTVEITLNHKKKKCSINQKGGKKKGKRKQRTNGTNRKQLARRQILIQPYQ